MANEPCKTCPWRKSSTVGGADIPNFDIALMRRLQNTVGRGDAFRPIMACHYSAVGKEVSCVGYLYREGYRNINVRLLASQGEIDFRAIDDACQPLDLWLNFADMLEAYEGAQTGDRE